MGQCVARNRRSLRRSRRFAFPHGRRHDDAGAGADLPRRSSRYEGAPPNVGHRGSRFTLFLTPVATPFAMVA